MADEEKIPESTLEMLARSIYKESYAYGFKNADYLRLVNHILDETLANGSDKNAAPRKNTKMIVTSEQELPLIGNSVKIRKYNSDTDFVLLNRWIQDKYGRHFLLSCQSTFSPEIGDVVGNNDNIIGMITTLEDIAVGVIAFLDVNKYQRKAELRKMIGEAKYRGMGLAKEATEMWINYGISTLNLKKVFLNTLNSNLRNIRLNEEVGFKVEGILRNEVYFDGTYHDVLRMGLVV